MRTVPALIVEFSLDSLVIQSLLLELLIDPFLLKALIFHPLIFKFSVLNLLFLPSCISVITIKWCNDQASHGEKDNIIHIDSFKCTSPFLF